MGDLPRFCFYLFILGWCFLKSKLTHCKQGVKIKKKKNALSIKIAIEKLAINFLQLLYNLNFFFFLKIYLQIINTENFPIITKINNKRKGKSTR